jgi:hypothetical protein
MKVTFTKLNPDGYNTRFILYEGERVGKVTFYRNRKRDGNRDVSFTGGDFVNYLHKSSMGLSKFDTWIEVKRFIKASYASGGKLLVMRFSQDPKCLVNIAFIKHNHTAHFYDHVKDWLATKEISAYLVSRSRFDDPKHQYDIFFSSMDDATMFKMKWL